MHISYKAYNYNMFALLSTDLQIFIDCQLIQCLLLVGYIVVSVPCCYGSSRYGNFGHI